MISSSEEYPFVHVQQGDRHFVELTESLRGPLYCKALQLARNPVEAEDLVQETYLRAYRFFEDVHNEDSIRPWMFRILNSVFVNQYRKDKKHRESISDEWDRPIEEFYGPSPGRFHHLNPRQRLTWNELDDEIEEAIDRLPDSSRDILMMATIDSLSYEQIAERLLCPVGTVRSRLSRAKSLLRQKLKTHVRKFGYTEN